jgi:DNA-binding transcriptional MerR regulator
LATENLLQIGDIVRICGVSVQTLRYYQKIGLINPDYTYEQTGYRYYSKKRIFLISSVKTLQSA